MTTKSVIQNLQDSELIRIFLQFVQTYHLQYEKIDKEISYKCHQATWILATTKATGYGRTQSQAYKHALRNLLEMLIQDPPYTQFFVNILSPSANHISATTVSSGSQIAQGRPSQNLNNKQKPGYSNNSSYKQKPLYSNLSASLTSNIGQPVGTTHMKRDFKTEAGEGQGAQQQGIKYMENGQKLNTSLSNGINSYANGKSEMNSRYQTMNRNNTSGSANTNIYGSSYKCMNPGYNIPNTSNEQIREYPKTNSTSNMTLESFGQNSFEIVRNPNKNNIPSSSSGSNKINVQMELKQALLKNKQLAQELTNINKQNEMLKMQLNSFMNAAQHKTKVCTNNFGSALAPARNHSNINNNSTVIDSNNKGMRLCTGTSNHNTSSSYLQQANHTKVYSHANINLSSSYINATSTNTTNNNIIAGINNLAITTQAPSSMPSSCQLQSGQQEEVVSQEHFKPRQSLNSYQHANKSKVMVPKLKLEILPNYHKKAQKSLNDSLLAVYEQKYGATNQTTLGSINMNISAQPSKKIM